MGLKLLIGLGNPGREYEKTRHNVGKRAVEALRSAHKKWWGEFKGASGPGSAALIARPAQRGPGGCALALSNVFMNASGSALDEALRALGGIEDFLVVCDDVSLELGRLRFRSSGSTGGHKGLLDIEKVLGSGDYSRLRVGVGRCREGRDLADFVLAPFDESEEELVEQVLKRAARAALDWSKQGQAYAMNRYNAKPLEGLKNKESTR